MVRLARAEVFDSAEIAIAHVYNRTVRRCFLMGDDAVSGKNFDHRKVWIEDYLRQHRTTRRTGARPRYLSMLVEMRFWHR